MSISKMTKMIDLFYKSILYFPNIIVLGFLRIGCQK